MSGTDAMSSNEELLNDTALEVAQDTERDPCTRSSLISQQTLANSRVIRLVYMELTHKYLIKTAVMWQINYLTLFPTGVQIRGEY